VKSFCSLGPLEYIHLENNLIEDVPKWAFRNLTELQWLSFGANRIRYLESGLLVGMNKLRRFSATNNRIEVVPSNLFHDNPVLREIYFFNNRIRMVGGRLVNGLSDLKVAAFQGNACTDISINNGDTTIRDQLTREFQTKCSIDCRHMEIAQQKFMKELKIETQAYEMCGRNWQ
jgi:Leucine-rich repeat (LRR) protein